MANFKILNNICIISLAFLIFALFMSIITFPFYYPEYNLNSQKLLEIFNNLNGKLIYSLSIKGKCSDDEEILSLGTWDGASSGCICSNNEVYKNYCSEQKLKEGCKNVNENPSKIFTIINSNYICLKKYKETYKELL